MAKENMSKLERLIQQYCPDGVEYVKLDSVANICRGTRVVKSQLSDKGYPVYQNCLTPMGYFERSNCNAGITFVICGGAAGNVGYTDVECWAADDCEFIIGGHQVINRYIYYYLMTKQNYLLSKVRKASIPRLSPSIIKDLEIPLPPLPVQEEIVRILDAFTELQAELQAELQKRKQQYNYYLDNLLNFNNINRGGYQAEVRWMKMSDIGTFYSGLSGKTKEDFQNGNAKFISYVNIFNNLSLITDVDDRVKIHEGERQNTIQYGDLLFTSSSETPDECGMCSVLTHHTEEKLYLNSFCFGFRFNDLSGINPEFMKFLFRSSVIRKLICKTANGVTRFNISKKEFAKIVIPIPSLAEQDHIASVLDKFYFLVGDLTAGLPAEIEKRRQQYEYYRDKLLTFKRKGA